MMEDDEECRKMSENVGFGMFWMSNSVEDSTRNKKVITFYGKRYSSCHTF